MEKRVGPLFYWFDRYLGCEAKARPGILTLFHHNAAGQHADRGRTTQAPHTASGVCCVQAWTSAGKQQRNMPRDESQLLGDYLFRCTNRETLELFCYTSIRVLQVAATLKEIIKNLNNGVNVRNDVQCTPNLQWQSSPTNGQSGNSLILDLIFRPYRA